MLFLLFFSSICFSFHGATGFCNDSRIARRVLERSILTQLISASRNMISCALRRIRMTQPMLVPSCSREILGGRIQQLKIKRNNAFQQKPLFRKRRESLTCSRNEKVLTNSNKAKIRRPGILKGSRSAGKTPRRTQTHFLAIAYLERRKNRWRLQETLF